MYCQTLLTSGGLLLVLLLCSYSFRRGYMKSMEESTGKPGDGEQLVRMNNERFMVPEVLLL